MAFWRTSTSLSASPAEQLLRSGTRALLMIFGSSAAWRCRRASSSCPSQRVARCFWARLRYFGCVAAANEPAKVIARLHAHRATGGNRRHRDSRRHVVAGVEQGKRILALGGLYEQPAPDRDGDPLLRRRQQ